MIDLLKASDRLAALRAELAELRTAEARRNPTVRQLERVLWLCGANSDLEEQLPALAAIVV